MGEVLGRRSSSLFKGLEADVGMVDDIMSIYGELNFLVILYDFCGERRFGKEKCAAASVQFSNRSYIDGDLLCIHS